MIFLFFLDKLVLGLLIRHRRAAGDMAAVDLIDGHG